VENIMEVIKKRRSVRVYKDKPLSEDLINSILESARYAPTAKDRQQLEYKVITNKNLIKRLSDSINETIERENLRFPPKPHFYYDAPLLIFITGPVSNSWIDTDAALAAQNIMLYTSTLGLGTCFIGMSRHVGKDLLRDLNIPEGHKIAAALVCGYPDEVPEEKEKRQTTEYFQ
jgi:nitroreductase